MRNIFATTLAAVGVLVMLTGCAASPSRPAGEGSQLQVFGASSTRVVNDALSELAAELDPPLSLTFNNDGSGSLITQLLEGAQADILMTADQQSMDQAVADGTVNAPVQFASNTMVMVVPADNPQAIQSVADLHGANDIHLVLCDPSVPCGAVSEKIIADNGLELSPVSLEAAVGDVLGKVHNGEADAGWVYRTDALSADADVKIIELPGAERHPNTLWVASTTASPHPERAEQLLSLILSDEMAEVWDQAGFTPARG